MPELVTDVVINALNQKKDAIPVLAMLRLCESGAAHTLGMLCCFFVFAAWRYSFPWLFGARIFIIDMLVISKRWKCRSSERIRKENKTVIGRYILVSGEKLTDIVD